MNVRCRVLTCLCGISAIFAVTMESGVAKRLLFGEGIQDVSLVEMNTTFGSGTTANRPTSSNNVCAAANIANACPWWSAPAAGCGSVACPLTCNQTQNDSTLTIAGPSKAFPGTACAARNQATCTAGAWFGCSCTAPAAVGCGTFTEIILDACS